MFEINCVSHKKMSSLNLFKHYFMVKNIMERKMKFHFVILWRINEFFVHYASCTILTLIILFDCIGWFKKLIDRATTLHMCRYAKLRTLSPWNKSCLSFYFIPKLPLRNPCSTEITCAARIRISLSEKVILAYRMVQFSLERRRRAFVAAASLGLNYRYRERQSR